jgi:hypothetical protein
MSTLQVIEDSSSNYATRTWKNAAAADLTVAFAVDFGTAGERLTKKAAGTRFLGVALTNEEGQWLNASRALFRTMKLHQARNLNIAGNGMQTMSKHGWTQLQVNQFVWRVLSQVHAFWPMSSLRSGGQTGADLAGAVSGLALQVPTVVLMPKGCRQRNEYGVDSTQAPEEVEQAIRRFAVKLNRV